MTRPIVYAVLLSLTAGFLSLALAEDGKQHYAVTTIKVGGDVSTSDAEIIADRLRVELFRTGKVALMEREQMNSILAEQGFQQSGSCTDEACLVEMGQLLGVQFLVSGSMGRLGSLLVVNFRVIDVQVGTITAVVSRDIAGGIETVVSALPTIAMELVTGKTGTAAPAPAPRAAKPPPQQPSQSVVVVEDVTDEEPPTPQPLATARLKVRVSPEDAVVLVNGKTYGRGDTTLVVEPGAYRIACRKDGKTSREEEIELVKGDKEEVNVRLERAVRFSLSTNFSFQPGASGEVGTAAHLGLKIRHNYLGLMYTWGFEDAWEDEDRFYDDGYSVDYVDAQMYGGGLVYGFVLNAANVLMVTFGAVAGFWYEDLSGEIWVSDSWGGYYDYEYYDNFYFGGPRIRIQIGYKYVFLDLDATLIFGSGGPKGLLNPGIAVYF